MGTDKAVMTFRDRPLWQRQIGLLHDLNPKKIFVSGRTEPSWLPRETELLLDQSPSRGPLSGLTRALERMQTSHLAVLAVDMPFMTSEQMQLLWGVAAKGCGVLPMIDDRAEPLAAIYPCEAHDDLFAALAGDDFSMQRLSQSLVRTGKLRIFQVPHHDEALYRSVNEPGDLQNSLPEFRRCATGRTARRLKP